LFSIESKKHGVQRSVSSLLLIRRGAGTREGQAWRWEKIVLSDITKSLNPFNSQTFLLSGFFSSLRCFLIVKVTQRLASESEILTDTLIMDKENET
jgi:hypothetical protein